MGSLVGSWWAPDGLGWPDLACLVAPSSEIPCLFCNLKVTSTRAATPENTRFPYGEEKDPEKGLTWKRSFLILAAFQMTRRKANGSGAVPLLGRRAGHSR